MTTDNSLWGFLAAPAMVYKDCWIGSHLPVGSIGPCTIEFLAPPSPDGSVSLTVTWVVTAHGHQYLGLGRPRFSRAAQTEEEVGHGLVVMR